MPCVYENNKFITDGENMPDKIQQFEEWYAREQRKEMVRRKKRTKKYGDFKIIYR